MQFSIIIPTLNSERTLEICLKSLRAQNFPQEQIEILIVDGGSADQTKAIAQKYQAIIVANPEVQPECAKRIGLLCAKGEILVFIDSDEEFDDPEALSCRLRAVQSSPEVLIWAGGGYRKPPGAHDINDYINGYSDPFSYFMYGISSEKGYYTKDLARKYANYREEKDWMIFSLPKEMELPLVDLSAGATLPRKTFLLLRSEIAEAELVPGIATLALERSRKLGVISRIGVYHHSAESLQKYLRKIRWRVIMNTFAMKEKGVGFSSRENFQPSGFRYKKFLFIPYSLTLILPLLTSLYRAMTERKAYYLLHAGLCFYTATEILWIQIQKAVGIKVELPVYGKK